MKILDVFPIKARKFVIFDSEKVEKYLCICYIITLDVEISYTYRNLDIDKSQLGYTDADLELCYYPNSIYFIVTPMYFYRKLQIYRQSFDDLVNIIPERNGTLYELTRPQFLAHIVKLNYEY